MIDYQRLIRFHSLASPSEVAAFVYSFCTYHDDIFVMSHPLDNDLYLDVYRAYARLRNSYLYYYTRYYVYKSSQNPQYSRVSGGSHSRFLASLFFYYFHCGNDGLYSIHASKYFTFRGLYDYICDFDMPNYCYDIYSRDAFSFCDISYFGNSGFNTIFSSSVGYVSSYSDDILFNVVCGY